MQITLKLQHCILLLVAALFFGSCKSFTGLKEAPGWVTDLTSQLRCGMTLEEVKRLTDRKPGPTTSLLFVPDPRVIEGYLISDTWADVTLHFREQKLISYLRTFIDGFASAEASPLVNLCTGELRYRIQLSYPSFFDGGNTYLNGRQLLNSENDLFLGVGEYEIRIEKKGYAPVVRELTLKDDREARGSIYLWIRQEEIEPAGREGSQ